MMFWIIGIALTVATAAMIACLRLDKAMGDFHKEIRAWNRFLEKEPRP